MMWVFNVDGANRMSCDGCGETEDIRAPMPLTVFVLWMKTFGKRHKLCRKVETVEVPVLISEIVEVERKRKRSRKNG